MKGLRSRPQPASSSSPPRRRSAGSQRLRQAEEDDDARPRTDDPARLLFRPLEPFLAESNFPVRPGQIRRASLLSVWQMAQPRRRARAGT